MKALCSVTVLFLFFCSQLFSQEGNLIRKHSPGVNKEGNHISRELKTRMMKQDNFNNKENVSLMQLSPSEDILSGYVWQYWDGLDWMDSVKVTIERDPENNTVTNITEVRDGSEWLNYNRTVETYDMNNNLTEWINSEWNGEWTENFRQTYTYNENGDILDRINYNKTTEGWENVNKETRTYDQNNYWVGWFSLVWNGTEWDSTAKQDIINDEDGNWTEFTELVWNGSAWENSDRETQSYDANGNWTEWFDFSPDGFGGWVESETETQTYDTNGNWTEWTESEWSGSAWIPVERETASYDGNNQVEWIEYKWNESGWIEDWRETNVYDENSNPTEQTGWSWDGEWVEEYQNIMTYDGNNNITVSVFRHWEDTAWVNDSRYLYTYSSPTDVEEDGINPLSYNLSANYPNPFNPYTLIQYRVAEPGYVSMKVYDAAGREAGSLVNEYKTPGEYSVRFIANRLASGVYFYKITVNGFTAVRKMLLLK